MARVSIYIPDQIYIKMLKRQESDKCSFSMLCANAFTKFLEDSGQQRDLRVNLKPADTKEGNV